MNRERSSSVTGGCLCGAVEYQVLAEPLSSIVCHCSSCRKAHSAPTVAWLAFEIADFELLKGELTTFPSSQGVLRGFCGVCGSPLTYANRASPQTIEVATVSMDDSRLYPPTREIWLEQKIPWESTGTSVALYPRSSGEGPYPT